MRKLIIPLIACIILFSSFSYARESAAPPNQSTDYLIPLWNNLFFKDQRATLFWASNVNNNLHPQHTWSEENYIQGQDKKIALKCLSYEASTTNDWFLIQTVKVLPNYGLNGGKENGL